MPPNFRASFPGISDHVFTLHIHIQRGFVKTMVITSFWEGVLMPLENIDGGGNFRESPRLSSWKVSEENFNLFGKSSIFLPTLPFDNQAAIICGDITFAHGLDEWLSLTSPFASSKALGREGLSASCGRDSFTCKDLFAISVSYFVILKNYWHIKR